MKLTILLLALGALVTMLAAVARARESRTRRNETNASAHTLNRAVFLWAIRQRESRDNPDAIGPDGERSAYQFTRERWRLLTNQAHIIATTNPGIAEGAAEKYLTEILDTLRARGLDTAPEFVAAGWNFGPWFRIRAVRSEYAQHVANLYWDRLQTLDAE